MKGKASKRKRGSLAVDEALLGLPLPPAFQQLVASFSGVWSRCCNISALWLMCCCMTVAARVLAAVNTVYNFLAKNKLMCTISAVASVLGRADPTKAEQEIKMQTGRATCR